MILCKDPALNRFSATACQSDTGELQFKLMKELSLEKMENIQGGACDGFTASAAVAMSTLGMMAVFAGPIGWGPALVWGGVGLYLGTQCDSF